MVEDDPAPADGEPHADVQGDEYQKRKEEEEEEGSFKEKLWDV